VTFLNYDVRIQNLGRSKGQGLEWGSGPYLLEPSHSHREQVTLVPLVDLPSIAPAVRRPREAGLGGHGPARCWWRRGIERRCPARGGGEAMDGDPIRAGREATCGAPARGGGEAADDAPAPRGG
jgi:hypothetical protein